MRTQSQLEQEIAEQVAALRQHGLRARLTQSGLVLQRTAALMASGSHAQKLWYQAAICHGIALVANGQLRHAYATLDTRPNEAPAPALVPQTPAEMKLQAMLLVNRAVCGASEPAMWNHVACRTFTAEAIDILEELDQPALLPWMGVALTVNALCWFKADPQRSRDRATRALRYIRWHQPQLYIFAQGLAGRGDGMVRTQGRVWRAGLNFEECLYYFNER